MADGTRTTGWYPDPWGTAHERYFDGSAWTRQTRVVGATDAVIQWPPTATPAVASPAVASPAVASPAVASPDSTAAAADAPGEPPVPMPAPAPAPGAPAARPPGWHPDPWRLAALRWWDGTAWTGHVSGPSTDHPVDLAGERALARWVQPLLIIAGLAQAWGLLASVPQAKWVAEHWDELTRTGGTRPTPPSGGSLGGLTLPILVAVGVLFMLWFYRAANTAWASGIPARRSPMLATFSFLIPIIGWWWPYQAAMDMVPNDDRRRGVIRRWWALWIFGGTCGPLIYVAAAVFDETVARAVSVVGAIAMVGAGIAARSVVEYVTEAHERLGRAAAAG